MPVAITVPQMIRWKLNELMARHRITNRSLGEQLGKHETSVSRMRTTDKMPRIDGDDLNELCKALTLLAKVNVTPFDLFEYSPDITVEVPND